MRRRQFLLRSAGMASAAAFGLSGCGSEGGDGTLKVLAASYKTKVGSSIDDHWDTFIAGFEKKNPDITVELELVPFTRIDKALAQRVKDGNAPDIAQANIFAPYAEDGQLYKVNELCSISVQADFITSFAQAGTVHFTQHGIPFLASTPRLFYNKALFKRAGITHPPRSWEELRSAALALKAMGVKMPYGLQFGPEAAEDEALAWMLAANGGYASGTGYDFTKQENVTALTWLRDRLVADGLAGPDPASFSRTNAYPAFLGGQVGMMNAHPLLLGAAEQAGIPYGHAPFPKQHGGAASPVGVSDWLMAFKQRGQREACGAFLDFLYGQRSATTYGGGNSALPVTFSASEALRAQSSQRPLWKFIDQMPDAKFQPVGRRSWPAVRNALRREIANAVAPGGVPEAVLNSLQTTAVATEAKTQP